MKKVLSNFFAIAIVFTVILSVGTPYASAVQGGNTLTKRELKALLASAKTPAEHRTIASYYRQQADTLNAKSAEHFAMAEEAAKNPALIESKQGISFGPGASHCRYFAKQYAEQAKKAAGLAASHEAMAAVAEQR